MKKVKISIVKGTMRYRVATIEDIGHFILDLDSSLVSLVFPFLSPFISKKYYPISEEVYRKLDVVDKIDQFSVIGLGFYGGILAILFPFESLAVSNPIIKILILILIGLLVIFTRIKIRKIPDSIVNQIKGDYKLYKVRCTSKKILLIYLLISLLFVGTVITLRNVLVSTSVTIIDFLLFGLCLLGIVFSNLSFVNRGNFKIKL